MCDLVYRIRALWTLSRRNLNLLLHRTNGLSKKMMKNLGSEASVVEAKS